MPLPEEVQRRLTARAVTDLDLASLLAMYTKPKEIVGEPPLDKRMEVGEPPKP
jgi:hypothetical protein